MESSHALTAFAALSQQTRLDAFRLLIEAGSEGMIAGDIAARLDVRPNTLSANLSVLTQAGLATATREGRQIRYRAEMAGLKGVLTFLMQDCCHGNPALCQPVIDEVALCDC